MNKVFPTPALCSLVHHLLGAKPGDNLRVSAGGFAFEQSAWVSCLAAVGHDVSVQGSPEPNTKKDISRSLRVEACGRSDAVTIRLGPVLRKLDPSSTWFGLPFPGAPSIFIGDNCALGPWAIQTLMPTSTMKYLARFRRRALMIGARLGLLRGFAPIQLEAPGSPLIDLCRRVRSNTDGPVELVFRLGTGTNNRKTTLVLRDNCSIGGYIFLQLADVPSANAYVENAAQVLSRLHATPSLRTAVAKPIYDGEWRGRRVLGMEGLDITPALSSGIPPALLDFLKLLYEETGYRAPLTASPFFQWALGLCIQVNETAQKTLARLQILLGSSYVPLAYCHRDFDFKNAVSNTSGVKIIDWEWARDGWPAPIDGLSYLLFRPDSSWRVTGFPKQSCLKLLEFIEQQEVVVNKLLACYDISTSHLRAYLGLLFFDRALNAYEILGEVTDDISELLLLSSELVEA